MSLEQSLKEHTDALNKNSEAQLALADAMTKYAAVITDYREGIEETVGGGKATPSTEKPEKADKPRGKPGRPPKVQPQPEPEPEDEDELDLGDEEDEKEAEPTIEDVKDILKRLRDEVSAAAAKGAMESAGYTKLPEIAKKDYAKVIAAANKALKAAKA